MTELLLLENPRRTKKRHSKKRHTRRRKNPRTAFGQKVVKHRPVFFGSKTKLGVRSPHKRLNPRKVNVMSKKHRRRMRRNPPFSVKGVMGNVKSGVVNAMLGAAGIAANNFLAGQIANLTKIDPKNRELVQIATALIGLPLIAKFLPKYRSAIQTASTVAAAVAIFNAGKKFLPADIQAQLSGVGYDYPWMPGGNYATERPQLQGGAFVTPDGRVVSTLASWENVYQDTPPML